MKKIHIFFCVKYYTGKDIITFYNVYENIENKNNDVKTLKNDQNYSEKNPKKSEEFIKNKKNLVELPQVNMIPKKSIQQKSDQKEFFTTIFPIKRNYESIFCWKRINTTNFDSKRTNTAKSC